MSKKLKILFVVEQNVASRFYQAYFNQFYGDGEFEFYLLNLVGCPVLEDQLSIYFKKMYSPQSFVPYRRQVLTIKKIIAAVKPDIIHAHETIPAFYANLANILAGKKAKLIYHRHHSFYSNYKKKIMDQVASIFSDKIICVSDFSKAQAIKEHPLLKHKIVRVYNGVTLQEIVLQKKEKQLIEIIERKPGCKILFLARLKPRKGHLIAIEIMQELVKIHPDTMLYIAGAGELELQIRDVIKEKNLEQHIILTGAFNGIKELLKAIDIVILPSESEAFSLTVLETLSQGKLLIASDLPSIKEIITSGLNGVLVNPFNKKDWIDKLCFYIENSEKRNEIALSGKALFDADFTMNKMAVEIKKIYSTLN